MKQRYAIWKMFCRMFHVEQNVSQNIVPRGTYFIKTHVSRGTYRREANKEHTINNTQKEKLSIADSIIYKS